MCWLDISSPTPDAFIRFANNGITTSGYRVTQQVSVVSVTEDKRAGNAAVSELTDDAIKRGVEQAEALARISKPNPEDMPALPAQKYPHLSNFDPATVRVLLLDGGKEPLATFGDNLADRASRELEDMGVELHMDTRVTNVDASKNPSLVASTR